MAGEESDHFRVRRWIPSKMTMINADIPEKPQNRRSFRAATITDAISTYMMTFLGKPATQWQLHFVLLVKKFRPSSVELSREIPGLPGLWI